MHDGDFVRISIQDTGIGIPEEILDKIFDPYFSTKKEGSGLGLAICHSIINKHDGIITVQSKPGKGTTFIIYLPAELNNPQHTDDKKPKAKSAVKAARIMVMDDEDMIRDVAKMQLSILGHEAILVTDGEQAINKYQALQDSGTPVDLVIMDLTIPGGMGGREAAQRVLQLDPHAKIIVASGYSNDPVMANYREYGFCAALIKPFDLSELRKGVEFALTRQS
jgi:CheY-like chemotaxis protein